jgi:phenylacetate-CoA ligase
VEPPDLARTPWMSAAERAELQSRRLAWMYAYAWEHCPFYRDLWSAHGLGPASVQGLDDLAALPIVDRDAVQAGRDGIRVAGEILHEGVTGGTTGHRLQWAYSEQWARIFWACWERGLDWAGLTKDRRLLVISVLGSAADAFPAALRVPEPIAPGDDEALARIDAFAPDGAYGYASHAYLLARELLRRGRRLPLAACVTTSEPLLPPWREVIEEAFCCTVYDNFGCNDGGVWGAQCECRAGFHQDVERGVLEFDGTGMVATDLWNTAFPFFRYRTGDAGSWIAGDCICGRTSPRFAIQGRVTDMLVTPQGPAGPTYVSTHFLYAGVDAIRIVQRAPDDVELLYVPNGGFEAEEFDAALDGLSEALYGLRPLPRRVDAIPPTLSGKQRVSVNLMA